MVGSILGLTIARGESIIWGWEGMGHIFFTWAISPILGFIGSFLLMKLMNKILSRTVRGLSGLETSNSISGTLLLIMVVIAGFSRAGNDISNAIAPIYPLFQNSEASIFYQRIPMLLGGVGYLIGHLLGRRFNHSGKRPLS